MPDSPTHFISVGGQRPAAIDHYPAAQARLNPGGSLQTVPALTALRYVGGAGTTMNLLGLRSRSTAEIALLWIIAITPCFPALAQEESSSTTPGQDSTATTSDLTAPGLPDAPQVRRDQVPPPTRLDFRQRVQIYRKSMTSFETALAPAFGAAVSQARNDPPEWGQGASGYGSRFASGYGRTLTSRTIRFGVAAIDHEDPRFHPTNETGFARRAAVAVYHVFIVPRDDGSQMPALSRFAGIYGAAFLANAWYPESRANPSHALLRGTTALSATVGWNVFREFWPDIKNSLHRHKEKEE